MSERGYVSRLKPTKPVAERGGRGSPDTQPRAIGEWCLGTLSRPSSHSKSSVVRTRHPPVVQRLLEDRWLHALLERNLPQRSPRLGRRLDDVGGAVVADVRVERGGRGA